MSAMVAASPTAFGKHRYEVNSSRKTTPLPLRLSSSHVSTSGYSCTSTSTPRTPVFLSYSINKTPAAISAHGGLVSPVRCAAPLTASPYCRSRQYQVPPRSPLVSLSRGYTQTSLGSAMEVIHTPTTSVIPFVPPQPRRYSLPTRTEQEHFSDLCRRRFYSDGKDTEAISGIEAILKESSTTSQSVYNRILAETRVQYHEHVANERKEKLERVMSSTGLDPRDERQARLREFLNTHATKGLIGTHPFVKGLYTLLNLQATRIHKGGAGSQCMEWTLEDEVFMEAGGGEWLGDSVAILKTVIGLTEVLPTISEDEETERSVPTSPFADPPAVSQSPLNDDVPESPFSDLHRTTSSASGQPTAAASQLPPNFPSAQAGVLQEGNKRTFRMNNRMTNPELLELAAMFPSWIATPHVQSLRFPAPTPESDFDNSDLDDLLDDLEGGKIRSAHKPKEDGDVFSLELKVGTGSLRIGRAERLRGWEGTLVERVKGWFRRTFVLKRS